MGAVASYAAGSRIPVNYYRLIVNLDRDRSTSTDVSGSQSQNHKSFDLINGLILIVQGAFSFEYDSSNTKSKYTGEALISPGINPHNGDIFTYQLLSGQVGVFQITSVNRLSMDNGSFSRVTFFLTEYASDGMALASTKQQVREIYYYNPDLFLTSDHSALLTTQGYVDLQALRTLRQVLIDTYRKRFYHSGMGTYMPEDKIYDPYVVEYLLKAVSITEIKKRPNQLLPEPPNMEYTIWDRLLDKLNTSLLDVTPIFYRATFKQSMWGTIMTPLVGEQFLIADPAMGHAKLQSTWPIRVDTKPVGFNSVPQEDGTVITTHDYYVLSEAFYKESFLDMSPLEQLLYVALTTGRIGDISKLIRLMEEVRHKDMKEMFYQIPLYLYLQRKAVTQISQLTQG